MADYEDVLVETCPGCKGEWLDGGELKKIVQTVEETFTKEEIEALDAINETIFTLDDTTPNQLKCPKCPGVELNRFNYAATSGIALDKCPGCRGIWLDGGELENVQILVEDWAKKLEEDTEKYGEILEKTRQQVEAKFDAAVSVSRFGFVNAILRRFL
jgi:Zn-finger nucleic acid-binding protein